MKNRLQVNLQDAWALAGHNGLPEEKNQGFSTVYTTSDPSSSSASYYSHELYSTKVGRRQQKKHTSSSFSLSSLAHFCSCGMSLQGPGGRLPARKADKNMCCLSIMQDGSMNLKRVM